MSGGNNLVQMFSQYSQFTPTSMSWSNINVHSKTEVSFFERLMCKQPEKKVQIIKNVSGHAKAGTTLAIMGSSGAGKTTLLNVLTARNISTFFVDGVVKINGQLADIDTITSVSAYVQQTDLFLPLLTVRENLVFHSLLRMDKSISDEFRIQRINEVMKELNLEKSGQTRVGGASSFKGISGGEMKRLSFAQEILTNPSIMFCDEPTSGLDSFMAANLIEIINKMAQSGRTIICTIHQPSTQVFNLFQNLLLMADGRTAYLGSISGALTHFSSLGYRCPANYNPADFYVQELAIIPGDEIASRKKINRVCDYHDKMFQKQEDNRRQSSFVTKKTQYSRYKVSGWEQYKALTWRSYLISLREPILTYIRIGQALIVATVISIFFANQIYDQRGAWNINGALFILVVNLTVQNAFAVVNVFCSEMPVFIREHNNGMYRVDAYFICKNLAEIPIFVVIPVVIVLCYYYAVGFFPAVDAFLYCMVVAILVSLCGVSFGYLISTVCESTDVAMSLGPPLIIPLQLLGGFFLNTKTIPIYMIWCKYISWFHYAFDLLVVNQWSKVMFLDCTIDNDTTTTSSMMASTPGHNPIRTTHWPNNFPMMTTATPSTASGGMCMADGKEVLEFLDLGHNPEWADFLALVLLALAMRSCAYCALLYKAGNR